ncbi:MAG: hypothetical protein AAF429_04130 [Pseudomonadota bacterium]
MASVLGTLNWDGHEIEFRTDNNVFLRCSGGDVEINVEEFWNDFKQSSVFLDSDYVEAFSGLDGIKRIYTSWGDDIIYKKSAGVFSGDGNDKIYVTATAGTGQIHTYAGQGNDKTYLRFEAIDRFSHGHHARGSEGSDTFLFSHINQVSDTIVGRIEDFNFSEDIIKINGEVLDFYNLPDNVRIVEFNGQNDDQLSYAQQWMLIETDAGGEIFYALNGARIDMDGSIGTQEPHFIDVSALPDFDQLVDVVFRDEKDYVPAGYTPDGGIIINDTDTVISDVLATVFGSNYGDLIAGGLNDDKINGRGGGDYIWGGSGHDIIHGKHGNDTLEGGSGNDEIYGGKQNDVLIGGDGNDLLRDDSGQDVFDGGNGIDTVSYQGFFKPQGLFVDLETGANNSSNDTYISIENVIGSQLTDDSIYGDSNSNTLWGLAGSDLLSGRAGNDKLNGGAGDDTLIGGEGNDMLIGGSGADVFVFDLNSGKDTISSFELGLDKIRVLNGNYDDLEIEAQDSDTLVTFSDGSTVLIWNTLPSEISESDIIFL